MSKQVEIIGMKDLLGSIDPVRYNQEIIKEIKLTTERMKVDYVQNLRQGYKTPKQDRTGKLELSIDSEIKAGGKVGVVGSDSKIAPMIEFGTHPHTIRIKNKKILSDGVDFFGKEVKHPGYKGNPALARAWFKTIGVAGKKFFNRLERRLDKIK